MGDSSARTRRIVLAFLAVAALVLFDQWSKSAIWSWLVPPPPGLEVDRHGHARYLILGDWLAFMTMSNRGAAFGQFGQYPHLLVGGRILAVLLLGWLLARSRAGHRLVFVAMTLVLAGAIGNLIDNLWTGAIEPGHPYRGVRDFIDVWFLPLGWDYHFPSFNVADSCITVGACLWILAGLLHRGEAEDEPSAGEDPASGA